MADTPIAVPTLTAQQVRAVDELCTERFRIPVAWLMEAAGWQLARHCRGRTAVVAGKGNNGGDVLAAARHLHRWGRLHSVACTDRQMLSGAAGDEANALETLGIQIGQRPHFEDAQIVLDGLLGTGLSRPPEGRVAEWIEVVNGARKRVVAADVPSGLDADAGVAHHPCVRAAITVTLGLPKPGLLTGDGPSVAGDVWVVDIGVPFAAYENVLRRALPTHLFSMHDRLQLHALRL
jgi:NAD(P)H-hydrate epimerase